MARRILGRPYLVEPGVQATRRGFVRSTGYGGKYAVHLTVVEGTEHLFTPEVLGPTVSADDGRQVRTVWAVGYGSNHTIPGSRGGTMLLISALPQAVRERYRLDGEDFLFVTIVEPGWAREAPADKW